jgi:prolyl-tRNA editing enzyme YbaK/EbsC (Cys-tRNA(Pro) deacylase)
MNLYDNIIKILFEHKITYSNFIHCPVYTSEEARNLLGHELKEGTKSLVLKNKKNDLIIVTVSEDERINFKKIQQIVEEKKLQMAKPIELLEKFGISIGGVAPFGYNKQAKLIVSRTLFEQHHIYINPGKNDETIRLSGIDFKTMIDIENGIYI